MTNVEVHFDPINANLLATNNNQQNIQQQNVKLGTSDVDENIPENPASNTRTFAVVIANQNYSNVAGVPLALNDGLAFSKYCEKTLGMPAENVRYYADASYGTMLRAIRDIKNIASAFNGDINIVFYYAGHGIPNEATKDAYLLPTDADGTQTEGCYSLNKLYSELGSTKAKEIVVFLDACFSGSKREEGMLASARGVALKAKKEDPRGNMVVFSAASDDETAFPYSAKGHGLFTYYLLKKLQETKGDVSLGELGDYISENVKQQSVVINRKGTNPNCHTIHLYGSKLERVETEVRSIVEKTIKTTTQRMYNNKLRQYETLLIYHHTDAPRHSYHRLCPESKKGARRVHLPCTRERIT